MPLSELATGAFVPVDKAIEGQIRYTIGGQYAQNSLWFKCPIAPTMPDLVSATVLLAEYWAVARVELSTSLTVTEFRAYDRTAQVAPSYVEGAVTLPTGGVAGDHLPNNCAACVSLRTGYGHRSARGRIYSPGLPEGKVVGNVLATDLRDALAAGIQAILAAQGGYDLELCVASRYHDHEPRVLGVMTPVLSAFVDQFIDSQRRRLPGRGN